MKLVYGYLVCNILDGVLGVPGRWRERSHTLVTDLYGLLGEVRYNTWRSPHYLQMLVG